LEARLKNPKLSEDQQTALSKQLITVIRSEIAYSQVENKALSQVHSVIDSDSEFRKKLRKLMKEVNMMVEQLNRSSCDRRAYEDQVVRTNYGD
jgi:hypothetical protein